MNVDLIFQVFNRRQVRYILIGGMNFLLRHQPVLTYDVDLWIEDTSENRDRCEASLAELGAEWGDRDDNWQLTAALPAGWLTRQPLFCLNSPAGAIDIFRWVLGLPNWQESFDRSVQCVTTKGASFHGLSDEDMLQCQYALEPHLRNKYRVAVLESLRETEI